MAALTFLLALLLITPFATQEPVTRLRDVKTIYIESLGESEGANLIREKLINALIKSKRFTVTDDREKADAILLGIATLDKSERGSITANNRTASGTYGPKYDATLVVRLVTQNKTILWVSQAKPGWMARSVSSSVAEKISKELIDAVKKDEKSQK